MALRCFGLEIQGSLYEGTGLRSRPMFQSLIAVGRQFARDHSSLEERTGLCTRWMLHSLITVGGQFARDHSSLEERTGLCTRWMLHSLMKALNRLFVGRDSSTQKRKGRMIPS